MAGTLLENDPNRLPVRRPHTSGSQPTDQRRQELNLKADRLESLAQEANLPLKVTGGNLLPGTIQFNIAFPPGINTPRNDDRIHQLELAFAKSLGVDAKAVRIDTQLHTIVVDRNDRPTVNLQKIVDRLPMRRIPLGSTVLGLADDGAPLLVRLPSPDASHILIAGVDETATTDLLRTTATSLEMLHHKRQVQILPIDGHNHRGLDALRQKPEYLLHDIVTDPADIEEQLSNIIDLKERRSTEGVSEPQIAIVINGLSKVEKASPRSIEYITRLLHDGRESGIHIVADTNAPISTPDLYPVRAIGMTQKPSDAVALVNAHNTDAHRLKPDEFVAVTGPGNIKFYPAHVINEDNK